MNKARSAAIGKTVEDAVREKMRDPGYRREYMLYRVRTAIAAELRSLRRERGMTQKRLAELAGVPQPQIARLESVEDERIPTLEQLVRLFAALGSPARLAIGDASASAAPRREIVLV